MITVRLYPAARRAGWASGVLAGLMLAFPCASTRGQSYIAIGPPSFQTRAGTSLEGEVLERLSLGMTEPGDLERLSRLTLLQSIALGATMRADLAGTMVALTLEPGAAELQNLAWAFDESLSAPPDDFASMARANELLAGVQSVYGQLEAQAPLLAASSPRAASHLQGVGRLLPYVTSALEAAEANLGPVAIGPEARPGEANALRAELRLLIRDVASVIRRASEAPGAGARESGLLDDLNRLFDLLHGFDRLVSLQAPNSDLRDSFRLVLARVGQVETRAGTERSTTLGEKWPGVRARINAIRDLFELPRRIAPVAEAQPEQAVPAAFTAQIDQALAELEAFLGAAPPAEDGASRAAEVGDLARRLRIKLLLLHQHVLASEPRERLAARLREIEALNQQLSDRAGIDPRVIRSALRAERVAISQAVAAIKSLPAYLPRPSGIGPQ